MKTAIFAANDRSLINFRGALISAISRLGHEVIALAPNENNLGAQLERLGARLIPVGLARAGINPLRDWRSETSLAAILRNERPTILLAYTIKPVVYGMPAAAKAGVPTRVALITGLGTAFHSRGVKGFALRVVASWLYRRAFRYCTCIVVQNEDIAAYFLARRILPNRSRLIVVPGSGVDTVQFAASALPSGPAVFLLLARMLRDKGIMEYVAAARLVKRRIPAAKFLLVGDTDPNPTAISVQQLEAWNREGVIEYHAGKTDVRPLLAACTVYVLPSYHEGMPRSVLEAMATGRPVVTTDTIGCRDTVLDCGPADAAGVRMGVNGALVPVRSIEPLAEAMHRLASDRALAEKMGNSGRKIAEERFEVTHINSRMLAAMNLSERNLAVSPIMRGSAP